MWKNQNAIHEKIMENVSRNSHFAFNPGMELDDEFENLRETRRSLGGNMMRGIEIDMDILADAYPQEAKFMSAENIPPSSPNRAQKQDSSPKTPSRSTMKPKPLSARKTPIRRFFKSENEREYARNLMKELVQIYILQGVHGKQAFRDALNETRRRIFLRRGEDPPSPPPVTSPVYASPYPKLQPPTEQKSKVSPIRMVLPAVVPEVRPVSEFAKPVGPTAADTPSRVKNIVAAINSTPKKVDIVQTVPVARTPGSAKIKAVVECIEATVAANTPGKRAPAKSAEQEPSEENTPSLQKARSSKRKVEATPASTDTTRSKRRTAKEVSESENDVSVAKGDTALVKKKKGATLEPIPEAQESGRPSRRAKKVANESLIKK